MRILTIDPGHTTGLAFKDFSKNDKPTTAMPVGFKACAYGIEIGVAREPDLIICERFTINAATAKKSRGGSNEAIELIGVSRYFALQENIPFEEQSPADAKNFCSDDKLRMLGWYVPGPDHARDALRHLVLAAVRHKVIDLSTLIH